MLDQLDQDITVHLVSEKKDLNKYLTKMEWYSYKYVAGRNDLPQCAATVHSSNSTSTISLSSMSFLV